MNRSWNWTRALAALAAVCGASLWLAAASAESPREDCEAACNARETACLEACGEHADPVECESACRDDAWSCRQEC